MTLAALNDPARLPQVVASVCSDCRGARGRGFSELLLDALSGRNLLLVLDNCEHLVLGAAGAGAGGAERLPQDTHPGYQPPTAWYHRRGHAAGAAADGPGPTQPEQSRSNDAVLLFVERAGAASAEFRLTERNAPAVAQVCVRLDDRFRMLGEGTRTAPAAAERRACSR
jgi:predicted ATPase